MSLAVYRLKS